MNLLKIITAIIVCVGLWTMPNLAQAQDLSLRMEPGVAVPLTGPQTDHFYPGVDVAVKGAIGLTSFLDVGPSVGVLVLPSKIHGVNAGTAWRVGGDVRLKRPHNNSGSGWTAVSPWIDGDLQYVRTGGLDRAGLSVGVGAALPATEARTVWVGPYVRYLDVVNTQKVGLDSTDAHVMIFGISVEVGTANRPAKEVTPVTEEVVTPVAPPSDRDHDGTLDNSDKCPDVPGPKDNFGCPYPEKPVVVVPQVLELKEKVQFPWNSAKLDTTANVVLDQVVAALLNSNVNNKVTVEGHASSEGKVEYNNKLSQKRADAVLEYLVSKGVKRSVLTSKGFGSSVPVATNKTEAGRVANRRVEFDVTFVIVKEGK